MRLRIPALLALLPLLALIVWLQFREDSPDKPWSYIRWKAEQLGNDPVGIDRFVDALAGQEYPGILRGPVGTLWAGGGNQVEREMLRDALYSAAGKPAKHDASGDLTRHLFKLEIEARGVSYSYEGPVGRLVADPLVIRFLEDGRVMISQLRSDIDPTVLPVAEENLVLHFSIEAPGAARPVRFRRVLFLKRGVHVVVVAPGRVPQWAFDMEKERARELDEDVAAAYLLALAHAAKSDAARDDLCKHFRTDAYYTEPRVLIGSRYPGFSPPVSTLDLRRNVISVVSQVEAVRAGFGLARSVLEGQIEGSVLKDATGGPVMAALEVFGEHLARHRASVEGRVALYEDLLRRVLLEGRPGDRLRFDGVVVERDDKGLAVLSIDEAKTAAMEKAKLEWAVLRGGRIDARNLVLAAYELEALLGAAVGADLGYEPEVALEESTRALLGDQVRIFNWREVEGKFQLSLEYQFIKAAAKGEVVYDSVDHWDEINNKPYRFAARYTVPASVMESGSVVSYWYSASRYREGDQFLFFSRKAVSELKSQGFAVLRYRDRNNRLSAPLKLYGCGTRTVQIWVNNVPRNVEALQVAGGFLADKPRRQAYKAVETIEDATHPNKVAINKYLVLDDPVFPLINPAGLRFQTAIVGRVVSSKTGLGVPNAQVAVETTRATGKSWLDGRFRLPVIAKPFGKFFVSVRAGGFAPFRKELDLAQPTAFPLRIELEPRPSADAFLHVTSNGDLGLIEDPRVRELLKGALADDPALHALVPRRPVAFGPGRAWAWLVFDDANFHLTGVTYDGLHGAAGNLGRWMGVAGVIPGGRSVQGGAISAYAGFIASWYAYSAGKLDALSQMISGKEFADVGHAHAMRFAMRILDAMSDGLSSWPAGMLGASDEAYRAGFKEGLAFFEENPIYRGQ